MDKLAELEAITQIGSLLEVHLGMGDKHMATVREAVLLLWTDFAEFFPVPLQLLYKVCAKKKEMPKVVSFLKKKGIELPEGLLLSALRATASAQGASDDSSKAALAAAKAAPADALSKSFPGLSMPNKPIAFEEAPAAAASAPAATAGSRERRFTDVSSSEGQHRSRSRSPARGGRADHNSGHDTSGRPVYGSGGRGGADRGYDGGSRGRYGSEHRGGGGQPPSSGPLQLYGIYQGNVSRLLEFGALVSLSGVQPPVQGMVHVTYIRPGAPPAKPRDVLGMGQPVWVKVISIAGQRIGLSMKDCDQRSGRDLVPSRQAVSAARAGAGAASAAPQTDILTRVRKEELGQHSRRMKRLSSPERFELKQLAASGVLAPEDMPDFDEEEGVLAGADEEIDQVEVAVTEEEPPFLMGQTEHTRDLSPVKVVAQPDGSMHRAAQLQSALAKERKELKLAQEQAVMDSIPKDLNRGWMDPMPEKGDRFLAADMRGALAASNASGGAGGAADVPEWKAKAEAGNFSLGKINTKSMEEQRKELPIYHLKDTFLKTVAANQVMVVVGETGSGKTTQMSQYLVEGGFTASGMIGCTQPRRVAATSVAERVAEEFGCTLGEEVGYAVRFDDRTSPRTIIKYMTDGMLMREYLMDNSLKNYTVMILDEAHERSLNTDVLMGLLKDVLRRRKDFRLICTSATLESKKFQRYFFDCPLLKVPGRMHPVETMYVKAPVSDYVDQSLATVMEIHLNEKPGDILVFFTGQEEIDAACETLHNRMKALGNKVPELIILPVYAAQPSEVQSRIFEPAPKFARKVILATNIAEASLTIDGIRYVVDPGFVKQMVYNPKTGMDALVVVPISRASANQRMGRAGRTGPGFCYRLFTEEAFKHEMLDATVPEIQRTNLNSVVLQLKAMGINDLVHFDFMDPPPPQTLVAALEHLYVLGALDDEGLLTRLGRRMAEFPMSPALAKMLLTAVDLGCSEEILTIVAMLSVENIFYRPRDKQSAADQAKSRFHAPEGDHLTFLNVYNSWAGSNFNNSWCYENFIQARAIRRAQDVRKQLVGIMDRYSLDIVSAGKNYTLICKAITAGYFKHACKKTAQEGYAKLSDGQVAYMHPSSALYSKKPEYLIYNEVVMTTKEYMRSVLAIDPKWLVELAPRYFQRADAGTLSKAKRREKIEPLYDRFNPPDMWRLSKRIAYRS